MLFTHFLIQESVVAIHNEASSDLVNSICKDYKRDIS